MTRSHLQHKKDSVAPIKAKASPFRQAVALYEAGRFEEAAAIYRNILAQKPADLSAWLNLGTTSRKLGQFEAAVACAKRALELEPANPSCLTNYGNALMDLDRVEEALAAHASAVRARPGDFLILSNYAIALRDSGYFEEALVYFDKALKIRPNDSALAWDRAITMLHMGQFGQGWNAFEFRWRIPPMQERVYKNAKRWAGQNLQGKTILIHEEQGFGDSILCSRYIPLVQAKGGRIILECKKPLHRLFSTLPGVRLVEPGAAGESFDYYIPMMSLPGVFNTDLNSIPPAPPLFVPAFAPPEAAKLLKLGKNRVKIGVVWSGSTTFANNRRRAVKSERFLPLAGIPGVQLYSLQKGPCESELASCGGNGLVHDLGPHLNDFADTAAILKQLDLVIMTDSSVAHLAGSLGIPVWNLLCARPYWLYLAQRRDSPWHPSMRLFRQSTPGDWDSVFARVKAELERMIVKHEGTGTAKSAKAG